MERKLMETIAEAMLVIALLRTLDYTSSAGIVQDLLDAHVAASLGDVPPGRCEPGLN